MKIILASGSPRRSEILRLAVPDFTVVIPVNKEILEEGLMPCEQVQRLSAQKANEVHKLYPKDVVIGCDTMVEIDSLLLGKPINEQDAFSQLSKLSGRWHNVHTGVTIIMNGVAESFVSSARVQFSTMQEDQIWAYIATKEPMDKAGSYAIQGISGRHIEQIEGDFYTIMGLPLCKVYSFLVEKGAIV